MFATDPRRWNKATGPISATVCSVLEAGWKPSTPGFWQAPDASATLEGALFNKAQIVDSFSNVMEMQTWKRAPGHSLSAGMEKGTITDFAKKARSQLIRVRIFMAARALDVLVCGVINEPHLPADQGPWPPGSTNCGNILSDQSHTHEGIRPTLLHWRRNFVCPRFVAT